MSVFSYFHSDLLFVCGPTLSFSAGNRGGWGKRLRYLELGVVLSLLIWSFEFEFPENLVSCQTYDSLVTAPEQCLMHVKDISRGE